MKSERQVLTPKTEPFPVPCADCGRTVFFPGRIRVESNVGILHFDRWEDAELWMEKHDLVGSIESMDSAHTRAVTRCAGCGFGQYLKGKDPNALVD